MKQGFGLQTINQPQCADEGTQSPRSHLSRSTLQRMRKADIVDHIFDLESRSGYGHLGAMHERSKENLVAVAMLFQKIEREYGPNQERREW